MNKPIKIVIGFITAFLVYNIIGKILIPSINSSSCKYNFISGFDERYNFLFKKSIISHLKCFYSIGNDKEALFAYNFENKYRFIIWEFTELNHINLNEIIFDNENSLTDNEFEAYNSYDFGPDPAIKIKSIFCINATERIRIKYVGLNDSVHTFKSSNIKGVYGMLNKVEIENEKGESQISMTFGRIKNIVCPKSEIVIFKKNHSLFCVIISPLSDKQMYIGSDTYLNL